MGFVIALHRVDAFGHDGITDDEGRAIAFSLCFDQGFADGLVIMAIDLQYLPAKAAENTGFVIGGGSTNFTGNLTTVFIVIPDQIIQSPMSRQRGGAQSHIFLDATITK